MMCDSCGKNSVAMHLTTIVNGEISEQHLCIACAQEQNIALSHVFDIGQLLSSFMQENPQQPSNTLVCPRCGMDLRRFRQSSLLGCDECYKAFKSQIEPLLTRVHGHVRHIGKLPVRAGGSLSRQREIDQLSMEMRKAISLEQFEMAAELRDKIRDLENQKEVDACGGTA